MNAPDTTLDIAMADGIATSSRLSGTAGVTPEIANAPKRAARSAARGGAEWLCLAAAPTFAIMALLSAVPGGARPDMLCAAAPDASPLGGMAAMYLLMSVFHATPWLKLVFGRRNHVRRL
jgi:hypothetical protein